MGVAIANLVNAIIGLLIFLLIAQAILSWLIAFNVINVRNQAVYQIVRFLDRITDPMLRPLRRIIPTFGGIDISPIVLLLALFFLRDVLNSSVFPRMVPALT